MVKSSDTYVSISEFCRRHKYDAHLLGRLLNLYEIQPDFKSGNSKLFKEERLKVIVQNLDGMLRKEN